MANQKHLDLLTQGVAAWNQWKGDTHETLPGLQWNFQHDADLNEADLSRADLGGVNLGRVELCKTNFCGAYLVGASFVEAEPVEANFASTNLREADLNGANASGANFSNADLRNADLSDADLSWACFQDANLSGANLSGAFLCDACFKGADLSGANLSQAILSKECLQGANLSGANLSRVRYGTLFPYVQLRRVKEAGALVRSVNTRQRRAERKAKDFSRRKAQSQEIILFTRVNSKLLRLLALSLLFTIGGILLLQHPRNQLDVVMDIFGILFFGLGGVIILFQFFRQLLIRTPLLIINDKGIEYFCPVLFKRMQIEPEMTNSDIMLTWKEIGAIGIIKRAQTNSFIVYASARRWRMNWFPSLRLSERLLPIPAQQVIALVQERYQAQLEVNSITSVEVIDDTDVDKLSRKQRYFAS